MYVWFTLLTLDMVMKDIQRVGVTDEDAGIEMDGEGWSAVEKRKRSSGNKKKNQRYNKKSFLKSSAVCALLFVRTWCWGFSTWAACTAVRAQGDRRGWTHAASFTQTHSQRFSDNSTMKGTQQKRQTLQCICSEVTFKEHPGHSECGHTHTHTLHRVCVLLLLNNKWLR